MSESYRELSTILAALRFYQRSLSTAAFLPGDIEALATSGGEVEALTAEEIDSLCEALNCGGYVSPRATKSERLADLIARGVTFGESTAAHAAHQAETEPGLAAYSQNAGGMSYVRDGEVEVDSAGPGGCTIVSLSDDPGAYVLGWIWVEDQVAGISRDEDETDPETEQGLD